MLLRRLPEGLRLCGEEHRLFVVERRLPTNRIDELRKM